MAGSLIALSACAEQDVEAAPELPRAQEFAAHVVESSRPAWSENEAWSIAPEPLLSIGAADGASPMLLSRVNGAARLADGRFVVADGGSSELRFYEPSGSFVMSAGGSGKGPGEFELLNRVWLLGSDTVAATQNRPQVTYYRDDGRYLGTVAIAPPAGVRRANVAGQTRDGAFLGTSGSVSYGREDAGRVISDTTQVYRITPDGRNATLLARYPGRERWGLDAGGRTTFPFLPFSIGASWAAGADRFAAGSGRAPEVHIWKSDGTPEMTVRWVAEPRPLTDALRDAYREERLASESDPNERRRVERFLAEAPLPDVLPVYRSLYVDVAGNLWVEDYEPDGDAEPTWQVFGPDGRWMGEVGMPARLRVFEIGEDYVLGRWVDGDGVEYVRLYSLRRPKS